MVTNPVLCEGRWKYYFRYSLTGLMVPFFFTCGTVCHVLFAIFWLSTVAIQLHFLLENRSSSSDHLRRKGCEIAIHNTFDKMCSHFNLIISVENVAKGKVIILNILYTWSTPDCFRGNTRWQKLLQTDRNQWFLLGSEKLSVGVMQYRLPFLMTGSSIRSIPTLFQVSETGIGWRWSRLIEFSLRSLTNLTKFTYIYTIKYEHWNQ